MLNIYFCAVFNRIELIFFKLLQITFLKNYEKRELPYKDDITNDIKVMR